MEENALGSINETEEKKTNRFYIQLLIIYYGVKKDSKPPPFEKKPSKHCPRKETPLGTRKKEEREEEQPGMKME